LIADDRLLLERVEGGYQLFDYHSRAATERYLTKRFGLSLQETHGVSEPLFAEWINQKLYVAYGELEHDSRNIGFGAVPSQFRVIGVEQGHVVSDQVTENTARICWEPRNDKKPDPVMAGSRPNQSLSRRIASWFCAR
jgi:hypothetical protein